MKVAVIAAGGIGGYYGGLLAKAGHEVYFVARGTHLDAIREKGLRVKSIDDEFLIRPARVTDNPDSIGAVDLVLFSVKTFDTEEAAIAIRPIVSEETPVVTFQNGIESAEMIHAAVGKGKVIPAPTQIESFIAEPGRIEQKSNFRVVAFPESALRSSTAVETLAGVFRQSNFQVNTTEDIRQAVWLKFLRLAPVSGLATLARATPNELFQMDEARASLSAAILEIRAVGSNEGVTIGDDDVASAMEWALGLKPGIKPSMQKDLERGNRLEIDALSGAVVRLGKKHRVATPVHTTIYAGLKPVDIRNDRARKERS